MPWWILVKYNLHALQQDQLSLTIKSCSGLLSEFKRVSSIGLNTFLALCHYFVRLAVIGRK